MTGAKLVPDKRDRRRGEHTYSKVMLPFKSQYLVDLIECNSENVYRMTRFNLFWGKQDTMLSSKVINRESSRLVPLKNGSKDFWVASRSRSNPLNT